MHIAQFCCIFFHLFPSIRPHDRYNHALLPPVPREENSGFPEHLPFYRLVFPQETELFFMTFRHTLHTIAFFVPPLKDAYPAERQVR